MYEYKSHTYSQTYSLIQPLKAHGGCVIGVLSTFFYNFDVFYKLLIFWNEIYGIEIPSHSKFSGTITSGCRVITIQVHTQKLFCQCTTNQIVLMRAHYTNHVEFFLRLKYVTSAFRHMVCHMKFHLLIWFFICNS